MTPDAGRPGSPRRELPPVLEDPSELERTWADQPGIVGWITSVDHKSIGKRYIVTAFIWFLLAGLLAAAMRLQLSRPDNSVLGPDLYNQIFTMHGTVMMFLFAVPMVQGLGVYLVPLMVGARSIAFPRLVAFSYWMFLFGGFFIFTAFALNTGPDVGWFAYTPLSELPFTPTRRADVWAQLITFTEVASLAVAVAVIVTTFKMRAPGMSLNRIPIFVWGQVVISFMIVFAMPAVMLASTALICDRLVNTHFYDVDHGGDSLLWQHLFWFFGHPEVYIIFMPALGMISSIVETFARRPIFGYVPMVLALVATGFLAFGLWVHHMFATNIPELGKSFFTAMSFMIAIPTTIQIFCWIATLATGRLNMRTPLLFIMGFFVVLIIGGMTGILVGSVPVDLQVHDTQFVVAHLHYVLIGGAVFPLFAAIYYWFPKLTGRMLGEGLGKWHFWLFLIGVNLCFFPLHELGLEGMPRRIYTYAAETGWGPLNFIATIGQTIVDVSSREPLWSREEGAPTHVSGLAAHVREGLVTTVVDAQPDVRYGYPEPSIWPCVGGITVAVWLIWSIYSVQGALWGMIPPAIAFILWFWPREEEVNKNKSVEVSPSAKEAA